MNLKLKYGCITPFDFFRKKFFSSNLFEYFFYFVVVSLLITIILGGALYFYFTSVLRTETIQSNNSILAQLKNSHEVILSEVENSMASLVLDPFLANYEDYYKSQEILIIRSVQNKLENTLSLNKYIDSLYIYYQKSDFVLSTTAAYTPVDKFYDRAYLQNVLEEGITSEFMKARTMPNYNSSNTSDVLTIIKPIPVLFSGKPTALVVINIKAQYLNQTIDYINIKKGASVFIINEEGNIVSQKENSHFLGEQDIRSYMDLEEDVSNGYGIRDVNGRKMLISFIDSDKYKLKFVFAIPMSALTANIAFVGKITLLLCFAILILSMTAALFLSKRIYTPIKTLLDMFKNDSMRPVADAGGPIKETAMIEKNINSLMNKNRNLEDLLKDYRVYQRNMFLRNMIEGTREGDDKIHESLSYYNIDLDMEGYFIVYIVSMDNYEEFFKEYSERQKNMLYIYISENMISEVFVDHKGFVVEMGSNEIVFAVNICSAKDADEARNMGYTLAKRVHSFITGSMKYTFTLGVSTLHRGVDHINACYKEGLAAVNYRLLLGYNNVILYENMETKSECKAMYPYAVERNILNNLKVGDGYEVMNSLHALSSYIHYNLSENIELVRLYYLQLLSAVVKCAYEMDISFKSPDAAQKDLYTNLLYTNLLREESMQGMTAYMQKLFESLIKISEEKRNLKNKELVDAIVKYITDNLQSDLCIERLADQFFISPSYIRKIFKDETNTTIKDFIDRLRMSRAKDLLQDPNNKISTIAEQIGYLSVQAFTKAFKMDTGKTPGEYRTQYVMKLKA